MIFIGYCKLPSIHCFQESHKADVFQEAETTICMDIEGKENLLIRIYF